MMQLITRHEAEIDVCDAAIWYDQQQQGLGVEFLDEVRVTVDSIVDRPESFPVVHRSIRRALVRRFPYAVYFVVRPAFISVIAIVHGSRDAPSLLENRFR